MALSDTIADLLTRVRNAKEAKHRYVDVMYSKQNVGLLKVLQETGFIEKYVPREDLFQVRIFLKYGKNRESAIQGLKRVSKPGARKYVRATMIPSVYGGLGVAVLSTPKGIIDGKKAQQEKVGGEHICNIW